MLGDMCVASGVANSVCVWTFHARTGVSSGIVVYTTKLNFGVLPNIDLNTIMIWIYRLAAKVFAHLCHVRAVEF